jgi:hypothetical protein
MSDRLTDEEAALVFRRATELDVHLARQTEGWDLPLLEAVGREVGIAPDAVRHAVAEVRLGRASVELDGDIVRATRVVPASPAAAHEALAAWLRDQLFDVVRDPPGLLVVDRRRDPDAVRRRQRDAAGRYRLQPVERVVVAVASVPGAGSAVRVEALLASSRRRRALVRGAGVAPAAWAAAAVVAGATGTVGMEHVWLATPLIAGLAGWRSWRFAGRAQRAACAEVELAIDGALDRLEG